MKTARLLLVMVWFASFAGGQTDSQCQQRCTNMYNLCTSNADQQLNQCLANAQSRYQSCSSCVSNPDPINPNPNCPGCSDPNGCTNNYPSCPTADCCENGHSSELSQCYTDHDNAYSVCNMNYSDCTSNCGGVGPRVLGKAPQRPRNAHSDALWALLMRNLSRPEKLKLPS